MVFPSIMPNAAYNSTLTGLRTKKRPESALPFLSREKPSTGEAIGEPDVAEAGGEMAGMLVTGARLRKVYEVLGRAILLVSGVEWSGVWCGEVLNLDLGTSDLCSTRPEIETGGMDILGC